MALPEVEELSHFRFHVPVFKVRGRTFLGMGADEQTAVFCIDEQDADRAAAADPTTCEAVRRRDARERAFSACRCSSGALPTSALSVSSRTPGVRRRRNSWLPSATGAPQRHRRSLVSGDPSSGGGQASSGGQAPLTASERGRRRA